MGFSIISCRPILAVHIHRLFDENTQTGREDSVSVIGREGEMKRLQDR